jgi:hypothetical protein
MNSRQAKDTRELADLIDNAESVQVDAQVQDEPDEQDAEWKHERRGGFGDYC